MWSAVVLMLGMLLAFIVVLLLPGLSPGGTVALTTCVSGLATRLARGGSYCPSEGRAFGFKPMGLPPTVTQATDGSNQDWSA
jgi:hypothetical protein